MPRDFSALTTAVSAGDEFELPATGVDLEKLERSLLVQALRRSDGNQTRAGALLGLNRDQIRYRIEKFGLARDTGSPLTPVEASMTNDVATIDVVVRDGSTVCLRRAAEDDVPALLAFLEALSVDSRYYRFLGLPALTPARIRGAGRTRHGTRHRAGRRVARPDRRLRRLLSRCRQRRTAPKSPSPSPTPCKGTASARGCSNASPPSRATQGIDTFDADVLGDNRRMLDVFRDSGFAVDDHASSAASAASRSRWRSPRPSQARRRSRSQTAADGVDEGVLRTTHRSRSSAPTASAARSARRSSTT